MLDAQIQIRDSHIKDNFQNGEVGRTWKEVLDGWELILFPD